MLKNYYLCGLKNYSYKQTEIIMKKIVLGIVAIAMHFSAIAAT